MAAPNCRTGYKQEQEGTKKRSRFHLPKDNELREKWMQDVHEKL